MTRWTHLPLWGIVLTLGCSMVLDQRTPPSVRALISVQSVGETYARAQQAAARLGTTVVREDTLAHTFVATTPDGVALHVHVGATAQGTELTVAAMMLPGQMMLGVLDEADTFLMAYHRTRE